MEEGKSESAASEAARRKYMVQDMLLGKKMARRTRAKNISTRKRLERE